MITEEMVEAFANAYYSKEHVWSMLPAEWRAAALVEIRSALKKYEAVRPGMVEAAWVIENDGEPHDGKHDLDFYTNEIDKLPLGTKLYTCAEQSNGAASKA